MRRRCPCPADLGLSYFPPSLAAQLERTALAGTGGRRVAAAGGLKSGKATSQTNPGGCVTGEKNSPARANVSRLWPEGLCIPHVRGLRHGLLVVPRGGCCGASAFSRQSAASRIGRPKRYFGAELWIPGDPGRGFLQAAGKCSFSCAGISRAPVQRAPRRSLKNQHGRHLLLLRNASGVALCINPYFYS